MKTLIELSNGMSIETCKSVLDALSFNGFYEASIFKKGFGSCLDKSEKVIKFTYKTL